MAVSAVETGRRVTALRHARFMRQRDLARTARVSRNTICEIEAGRSSSVRTIQRIAEALGVKVGDLLDGALPRLPESPNGR